MSTYDEFGFLQDNMSEWGIEPREVSVRRAMVAVEGLRHVSALVWGDGAPEMVLLHGSAQNAHSFDTVAVLEARQIGRPAFVTVVEAGLLAKLGMNSAGVGLVTNAIVTDLDRGEPGIPYHVLLRSVLDSETVTDVLSGLQAGFRSSSANYLLASADGVALDVEAAPGDFSRLRVSGPEDGLLLHTNHLLQTQPGVTDVSLWAMPDSAVRLQRARPLLARAISRAQR